MQQMLTLSESMDVALSTENTKRQGQYSSGTENDATQYW